MSVSTDVQGVHAAVVGERMPPEPSALDGDGDGGGERPHIVSIIFNAVTHDTRVIKQAEGLEAAGYRVTILGIKNNRHPLEQETLPSGVEVRRVNYGPMARRIRARYAMVAGAIAAVGVGLGVLIGVELLVYVVGLLAGAVESLDASNPVRRLASLLHWYSVVPAVLAAAAVLALGGKAWLSRSSASGRLRAVRDLFKKIKTRVDRRVTGVSVAAAMLDPLDGLEPDILYGHEPGGLRVASAWKARAKKPGVPIVFDAHELYEEQAGLSRGARWRAARLIRELSPGVSVAVTVNDSIAEEMVTRYPRLPKPIIVVKNAAKKPAQPPVADGRLREAAGMADGERMLLYQGGFAPNRGLEKLVTAAPRLPDGWVLVMMGWGNQEPVLRQLAGRLDPHGAKVRFVAPAPQPELLAWTCGADLGVIPYENVCMNHWLCSPNKLWEYPMAGVPILASPFPELRAACEGRGIGWLVDDPLTPGKIVEVVGSITPEALEEKRAKCRAYAEADHWGVYERRLVEAVNGVRTAATAR